jgi:CBS domain-containing protein
MLDERFLSKSIGLLNPPAAVTIPANGTVHDAVMLLQEHRSGCLVVVDERGKLAGIFTERDVVLRVVGQGIDMKTTPVETLMTKNPETAKMTTTVAFSLNMMSHGGYRNIPVVDDDQFPVGLVSVKNLVDFLAHSVGKMN